MSETPHVVTLTENERLQLAAIKIRMEQLRSFLVDSQLPSEDSSAADWFKNLAAIKAFVGNSSNDLSFVSCLLAKDYLYQRFAMRPFDVAQKPQGAPGIDIDERTVDNKRIIGEIKTTTPYKDMDFGAQKRTSFFRDFKKLHLMEADHKFLFVTDRKAHFVLKARYLEFLSGVEVVLLTEEHRRSSSSDWLRELYDHFAPVRQEALERGISDEEIDAHIDAAVAAVRAGRSRQRELDFALWNSLESSE